LNLIGIKLPKGGLQMVFIGMDVHLKSTSVCVYSQRGEKLNQRNIRGPWPKVIEYLKTVKEQHKRVSVCFEASCGSGHLHDQLKRIVDRVVVAHPGRARLIFNTKKKNDRIDAEKLAILLFLNQAPPVHVPEPEIRTWRKYIGHRERLVQKRAREKNEIRSLLHIHGIRSPYRLWTKKGIEWLRNIKLEGEFAQMELMQHQEALDFLNESIRQVEKMLCAFAKRKPAVALLMTIPGIGIRTAECIVAYIDDPDRFGNAGQVSSYFGLVPTLDSTAGKDRLGHITKQGPAVARRLLVEAAWMSIRKSDAARDLFERISGGDKDRRKIAIIAVAHYLLRVCYGMLKTGECWREAT
jgi:transposase